MKEIDEELLYKILKVYELGTKKDLDKVKEYFEDMPHIHREQAELIKAPNTDIYAKWSTIFKIRNRINAKKKSS